MTLKVNEIFFSIQGESVHTGLPCIFVRLTGCNLRCAYCDTTYAYDDGRDLTVSRILAQVAAFACRRVEITGGEPLLQEETPVLARRLLADGYEVLVETNGSLDIDRIDRRCSRIMDVKCPSSGEAHRNHRDNFNRLTRRDQVKLVIGNREDFQFASRVIADLPPLLPRDRILFSAVHGRLPLARLARWMLDAHVDARLQVQLQKIIWPHRDRGV